MIATLQEGAGLTVEELSEDIGCIDEPGAQSGFQGLRFLNFPVVRQYFNHASVAPISLHNVIQFVSTPQRKGDMKWKARKKA